MLNIIRKISVITFVILIVGCSSAASQKQKYLEMVAKNRASLLASELPLESGPLSIMRANSKGNIIEIMMVYNDDAKGAKPTASLLSQSLNTYCNNKDTKANLDLGIHYRIKIRNSRGQLMADELVTPQKCQSQENNTQ